MFSLCEGAELFLWLDDAHKLHLREMSVGKLASLLDRAVLGDGPGGAQPVASRLAYACARLAPERHPRPVCVEPPRRLTCSGPRRLGMRTVHEGGDDRTTLVLRGRAAPQADLCVREPIREAESTNLGSQAGFRARLHDNHRRRPRPVRHTPRSRARVVPEA